MSAAPQACLLPDGQRLHLHHGPIDLIIGVLGPKRDACYQTAARRFQTILSELVAELPQLRRPLSSQPDFHSPVACRMADAVAAYNVFVTPMAAVAGGVADEILDAMIAEHAPPKAYVNNGGDIAFHLAGQEAFHALGPAGKIKIIAKDTARGVATSGWRGRSHSLGIADAVTVVARTAAQADVAATLIANAVDLPGHPAISRTPASELSPDSDLAARLVTTNVGPLPRTEAKHALENGASFARKLRDKGLIDQASLSLQSHIQTVSAPAHVISQGASAYA